MMRPITTMAVTSNEVARMGEQSAKPAMNRSKPMMLSTRVKL
jgi:hypothetical protein